MANWICVYCFTNYKIARKVLEKYRESVAVEIILQDSEINIREELVINFFLRYDIS